MAVAAPRIDPRLQRLIERRAHDSAAAVTRDVGDAAWSLGLTRPSYQQVRTLLRVAEAESGRVTDARVLLDVALRTRPAWDLANRWYGDPLPRRPGAKNEPQGPSK
ncbi:MAG TPA: hypothetical protein VH538_00350 [Gaiellaceae bacterium]|jgi:hypothetical protein